MSEGNGKYAPRPGNIPGVAVNLGGIDFVLAPLGLRLAREFEAKGKQLRDENAGDDAQIEFGIEIILASLNRNYPEITLDELRELIDSANVIEAQQAIAGISGMKRVKPGELAPRSP